MNTLFARIQGTFLILLALCIALLGGMHGYIVMIGIAVIPYIAGCWLLFWKPRQKHRPLPNQVLGVDLSKF